MSFLIVKAIRTAWDLFKQLSNQIKPVPKKKIKEYDIHVIFVPMFQPKNTFISSTDKPAVFDRLGPW